jgi:hypothetical protein
VNPRAIVLALACAFAGLAITVHPPPTPGVGLRDFEAYYAAGVTWRYHGDPYGREVWRVERTVPGVVATRDELLPFVGPPFGLPLWDALSRFPWPLASVVWSVVLTIAFAGLAFGSLRAAGGDAGILDALSVLLFAGCFGPLTSGVALGQVAVLSCAAIAVMPLLLGPRMTFAVAAAALVAMLQPNLALALIVRATDRRAAIAFVLAGTIAAGGSLVALAGIGGIEHYLTVLREHAAAERFIAIQTTVAGVARGFGISPSLAGACAIAVALATFVALAFQMMPGRYEPTERLTLACAALPLALPFSHEHDFTLALLPAVVVTRRARGVAWVLGACASVAISVDWLGLAQRPNALATATLLAVATALALAALARERLAPLHFLPLVVAFATLLAGTLAAGHALPTWPDHLSPQFSVAAAAPAAAVWHAEQIASGVGGLDPAWAFLRALSLAGCALLWGVGSAVLLTSRQSAPRSAPSSIPLRQPAATHPSA